MGAVARIAVRRAVRPPMAESVRVSADMISPSVFGGRFHRWWWRFHRPTPFLPSTFPPFGMSLPGSAVCFTFHGKSWENLGDPTQDVWKGRNTGSSIRTSTNPPQVLVPPRPRCSLRRRTVRVTQKFGKSLQRGSTLVPAPVYPSPGLDGLIRRRASIGAVRVVGRSRQRARAASFTPLREPFGPDL